MAAPAGGALPAVRVRMYRQGLGDCFLITFDVGGDEKHVLIDCGSLGAVTTGVKLKDVVEDIQEVTGKHLDLLVATHEHSDHVIGFGRQETAFQQFLVDRVWLAWTEDPEDELARTIARTTSDLGAALTAAAAALDAPGMTESSRAIGRDVRSLLGFYGADEASADDDADAPLGVGAVAGDAAHGATAGEQALAMMGAFSESVDAAMKVVSAGLGRKPRYLLPGQPPIEEDWLPGFRIYVLGPPHDKEKLQNLEEHGADLYSVTGALKAGASLQLSGQGLRAFTRTLGARGDRAAAPEAAAFAREWPFDQRLCVAADDPRARRWFAESYDAPAEAWRRVDEDWLHVASDLALQLDAFTNNTSLVLAIERVADGRVLLFPADAQQGNWESWHDPQIAWTVPQPDGTPRAVNATDLLARTVFYKVGHHGSHNATAKLQGLELMTREAELTAFVPVDRAVALTRNPKGAWKMPARPLYRRLLERCQGRVVRSDTGWADDAVNAERTATEEAFVQLATDVEWQAWKENQTAATHVTVTRMFVDYVLK